METVDLKEVPAHLSRLVAAVESGVEREIVIAREGRPVARLVPAESPRPLKLGLFDGQFEVAESQADFDAANEEVARLFTRNTESR